MGEPMGAIDPRALWHATRAMGEFADAVERMVDAGARRLAPADDPAVEIVWTEAGPTWTHVEIRLQSGRVIRGSGLARLEALVDAEAHGG